MSVPVHVAGPAPAAHPLRGNAATVQAGTWRRSCPRRARWALRAMPVPVHAAHRAEPVGDETSSMNRASTDAAGAHGHVLTLSEDLRAQVAPRYPPSARHWPRGVPPAAGTLRAPERPVQRR